VNPQQIREIPLAEWDPLNVGDSPKLADEYDRYVPGVLALVNQGASVSEIEQFFERGRGGLGNKPRATAKQARGDPPGFQIDPEGGHPTEMERNIRCSVFLARTKAKGDTWYGEFQFINDGDGLINHRLFVPTTPVGP
jgi:hypothetical protein